MLLRDGYTSQLQPSSTAPGGLHVAPTVLHSSALRCGRHGGGSNQRCPLSCSRVLAGVLRDARSVNQAKTSTHTPSGAAPRSMRASTGTLHVAWKARSAGISVVCNPPALKPTRIRKVLLTSTRVSALGSDQSRPDVETVLLSSVATIGLFGTVAVTGASLCGIKLFSLFQWERDEIMYAVGATIPLLLVELLLFAPRWSIPTGLLDQHSIVKQGTAHDTAHDTMQSTDQPQPMQLVDISAAKNCSLWSLQNWQLMLALYKSVLQQSQAEQVPKVANVGLLAARQLSRELLQRGFLLYGLAHWLIDRLYEAGFDDVVTIMGDDVTVNYLGFSVASFLVTAAVVPAVNDAADEAAGCVGGAMLLRTEAGQALAARASSSSSRRKQQEAGALPKAAAQAEHVVQSQGDTAADTSSAGVAHQQQPDPDDDCVEDQDDSS